MCFVYPGVPPWLGPSLDCLPYGLARVLCSLRYHHRLMQLSFHPMEKNKVVKQWQVLLARRAQHMEANSRFLFLLVGVSHMSMEPWYHSVHACTGRVHYQEMRLPIGSWMYLTPLHEDRLTSQVNKPGHMGEKILRENTQTSRKHTTYCADKLYETKCIPLWKNHAVKIRCNIKSLTRRKYR